MVMVGPEVQLWRVGREADPLAVDPKFQGSGRFDDPRHIIGVLYSADSLRTCLLELIAAWAAAPELQGIQQRVPQPTTPDEERDAERDRQIAGSPRRVPQRLYERVFLGFVVGRSLQLCDFLDVATRTRLSTDLTVARELRCYEFADLDMGAVLSPHRPLTQAIAQVVMRAVGEGVGICTESRHGGRVYNFFVGPGYDLQLLETVPPERLSREHSEVVAVARDLGLLP